MVNRESMYGIWAVDKHGNRGLEDALTYGTTSRGSRLSMPSIDNEFMRLPRKSITT